MNAKLIYRLMILCMAAISSLSSFADSGSSQNSNSQAEGTVILKLKSKDPTIKRAPSRNCLELQYSDGLLSLYSECYEGEFAITFESCEASESYEIPTMAVGESAILYLPSGEYNVTAVDLEGRTFSGCLIL